MYYHNQHNQNKRNHNQRRGRNKHRNIINVSHSNKIRSKTPDPISRNIGNYNNNHYNNNYGAVITPTKSSNGSERDLINRLNKQYSYSQTEDEDDHDGISSDSESYRVPFNNKKIKKKKKISFIPPTVDTASEKEKEKEKEKEDDKPPPAIIHRSKPASPRYKPEQLQRRQSRQSRQSRSKPNKPNKPSNKPPQPISTTYYNGYQSPLNPQQSPFKSAQKLDLNKHRNNNDNNNNINNNNNYNKPSLQLSSTSMTQLHGTALNNMTSTINDISTTNHKNKNINGASDNLYGIKAKQTKEIPKQANVEELMAQHEGIILYIFAISQIV